MIEYSGKFVLRIPPELHSRLTGEALKSRVSLNQLCLSILSSFQGEPADAVSSKIEKEILPALKKNFNKDLIAVAIFGSQVTGEATTLSDIDLYIVLNSRISIARNLYRWWDDTIKWENDKILNPHFVNFPKNIKSVTGIWFEVAQNHKTIYAQGKKFENFLRNLISLIKNDRVRKHISNGHPYWVWRDDEKQNTGI